MARMRRTKTELEGRIAELEEQLEEIYDQVGEALGIEEEDEEDTDESDL